MSNNESQEVKEVDEVVKPAEADETTEPTDSSPEETKEPEESEETEEMADAESEESKDKPAPQNAAPEAEKYGEVKPLAGETKREFALRIENSRLRDEMRGKQTQEILTPPPPSTKAEISPEKKKILEKYKPEDIQTLKEVFDVMADDMGLVKKDQLGATRYREQAIETLDRFLEKHPEYLPQNDPGNVLWNRFKEEFEERRPAKNAKELNAFLEKTHREVFGIKPAAALNKNEAAKENVKVASHSGSSRPTPSREGVNRAKYQTQGLRTDMLKGFSEEEIANLTGE